MNIEGFQAMMNSLSDLAREHRSKYHLTLGGLIAALQDVDASMPVKMDRGWAPGTEHSYRGYYADLSFEADSAEKTAGQFLEQCKAALGATYQGYKGGDYVMGEDAPLWSAEYGCCGSAIVGFWTHDGTFTLVTKVID